jgi:hypothetical protein
MSDKFMGYSTETGHPLEDAVESFLIENTEWILSQDAVVKWCIVEKPPGGSCSVRDAASRCTGQVR